MKTSKKKKILKILLIVFGGILILFAALYAVWYFGYQRIYDEMAKNMSLSYLDEEDTSYKSARYYYETEEYVFVIKKTIFPSFEGGFACVGSSQPYEIWTDENGSEVSSGLDITLYVWPQFGGSFETGLDFYDEVENLWIQIYVDPDLKIVNEESYDPDLTDQVYGLIEENKDEIDGMFAAAEKLWGIEIRNN